MKRQKIILVGIFAVAVVLAVLASVSNLLVLPNGQIISVTGTYTAKAEPTEAALVISFENEANTAAEAQQKNAEEMEAVLTALKSAGLSEDNFETLNYNIWDRKSCWECVNPRTAYVASHTLEITTENINLIGLYLDTAVGAGAKNVYNVQFSVSEEEEKELKAEALKKAAEDARNKAEALAAGMGMKVYRVVSISDSGWEVYPRGLMYEMTDGDDGETSGSVKIEPAIDTQIISGDVEYTARVYAEFELA